MKKYIVCILFALFLLTAGISTAVADDDAIIVTGYVTAAPVEIETDQPTVDIPIVVEALYDVYAFEVNMKYAPDVVRVESIAMGDIFSDFGSAVVKNDIDNGAGQLSYMQTILSAEHGAVDGGVLCVIRVSFEDGTYDAADDLGLTVKIADSTPEYMAAYTTPCTIIVDTQAGDDSSQPTPTTEPESTAEPAPTATIGVITPNPQSEQAETFVVAEDESTDEIIEAAAAFEETPESTEAALQDAVDAAAEPLEPTVLPSDDTPYWIIWAIAAAAAAIATVVWLLLRRKRRETEAFDKQGEGDE